MQTRVDLNADMGESFGPWGMGDDAALLDVVSSANIACGFHAGDWDVMAATMARAVENDVGIGAHPGFPDLQGFGRRRMDVAHPSLANLVRYQLGAAQAAPGTVLRPRLIEPDAALAAERRAAEARADLHRSLSRLVRDPGDLRDLLSRQLISGVTAGSMEDH